MKSYNLQHQKYRPIVYLCHTFFPDSKDTRYEVVEKIVTKILKSNEDISKISNTNWNISVVNSKSEITCALPNGKIFIFTGIFKTVNDDDQLALLLAHEIGT